MRTDLLALQASHLFYFLSAISAWNKGYKGFSIVLFTMIAVSLVNHRAEQIYNIDSSALEWFEKIVVIITGTYAALLFREYIDATSWLLLGGSIVFFIIGAQEYYRPHGETAYISAHTMWHLGTGFAILRIISSAPDQI
jgi:hypothetical protein